MRILVISDIHANLTALEAVLDDAGQVDETWCLGDIIGYGPDPNQCVDLVRSLPNLTCLLGNHDVAALGKMPLAAFNMEARRSIEWQTLVLDDENREFLHSLPETTQIRGDASLVHGSPRDPVWEYIINTLSARMNFTEFHTKYCFVGHSHLQAIFEYIEDKDRIQLIILKPGEKLILERKAILNPGSVGQPRDRDPRAAYAIFSPDEHTWEVRRVAYDIESVQQRIRQVRLPEKHAIRLAEGW
jgi:predicted phosphodiesterase